MKLYQCFTCHAVFALKPEDTFECSFCCDTGKSEVVISVESEGLRGSKINISEGPAE
jgi:hypothetical protein